ncbi:unnamed protein product [Prorocentrum cordatum]|uniref:Uncharacterized protein n=1 Tax=Prorocentrum cordatum TaxID=2364126 RepID=A0ABN9SAJ0_9DINO|nr:unnamed protein product [Polarella glacialis]
MGVGGQRRRRRGHVLRRWVASQGGWLSDKIGIRRGGGRDSGRGVFATADVPPGEALVSLPPRALLLSEEATRDVPCSQAIAAHFAGEGGAGPSERHVHGVFSIMVLFTPLRWGRSKWVRRIAPHRRPSSTRAPSRRLPSLDEGRMPIPPQSIIPLGATGGFASEGWSGRIP